MTPEHELLLAIIHRAILDALMDPDDYEARYKKTDVARLRGDSIAWLSSNSNKVFSSNWILEQVSNSPHELKKLIFLVIKSGDYRVPKMNESR